MTGIALKGLHMGVMRKSCWVPCFLDNNILHVDNIFIFDMTA